MSTVFIGNREYFPGIGQIPFEGKGSDNPLAFKVYDANKVIGVGPLLELSDDMHADIARIQRWYKPYKGRNHDVRQPAD